MDTAHTGTSIAPMILPKFDSSGSLIFGALISVALLGLNLVSLFVGWHDSFFPFQVTRLLGIAVGIALGIHCIDMIGYYARRRREAEERRSKQPGSLAGRRDPALPD